MFVKNGHAVTFIYMFWQEDSIKAQWEFSTFQHLLIALLFWSLFNNQSNLNFVEAPLFFSTLYNKEQEQTVFEQISYCVLC